MGLGLRAHGNLEECGRRPTSTERLGGGGRTSESSRKAPGLGFTIGGSAACGRLAGTWRCGLCERPRFWDEPKAWDEPKPWAPPKPCEPASDSAGEPTGELPPDE